MLDSNTQTQPVPPVSTGLTVEELQAQLDVAKKESEGRLRDLQGERTRRQELEQRLENPPAPSPGPQPDAKKDEVAELLNPYLAPVAKQAAEAAKFAQTYYQDKAVDFLAQKTGKSKDEILADTDLQNKLIATAQKWRFMGNVYDVTQRAYEALELEGLKVKETERTRTANASANSGLPSGAPPPPPTSSREFSQQEWTDLPKHEYAKLEQSGTFRQNEAGKIVYTPKK